VRSVDTVLASLEKEESTRAQIKEIKTLMQARSSEVQGVPPLTCVWLPLFCSSNFVLMCNRDLTALTVPLSDDLGETLRQVKQTGAGSLLREQMQQLRDSNFAPAKKRKDRCAAHRYLLHTFTPWVYAASTGPIQGRISDTLSGTSSSECMCVSCTFMVSTQRQRFVALRERNISLAYVQRVDPAV
jgi:hypothetical protein